MPSTNTEKRPRKHLRARAAVDGEVRRETDIGVAEVRCRPRAVPAQMVAVWWLLLGRSFYLTENTNAYRAWCRRGETAGPFS